MNWYYESGGQQQGPVTETDLDRLLSEGKINPDTLIWREGMSGWTPLRTARPSAAPSVPPSPVPPAPGLSLEPSAPGAIPSSTAGSDQPQPGWIRCSFTGRYFPPSEIIYLEGKPYSAAAKPQVIAAMQGGTNLPTPGISGERTGPAWEQRDRLGVWKALIETVKSVLTMPVQCFATMKREGGLGSPLLFWLATAGVGQVIGQIYQVLFQGAVAGAAATGGSSSQLTSILGMQAGMGMISVVLTPVMALIGIFFQAGLTHLSLMLLKGANHPFETTFRTVAYAVGGTGVLHLIPMCGSLIAGIWGLIALCIGLGPAQGTTTGKAVGAVLLPIAVCCLGVMGIAFTFGAIAAAAGGSSGP